MGQYWKAVNLDKHEYIDRYKLGCGAKLYEQLASPGVGQALVILLAVMPEKRGGGDLTPDPVIGRWAGDRVVLAGDYADDSDFCTNDPMMPFSKVYECATENALEDGAPHQFKDISLEVAAVIERELDGKFVGEGWKDFVPN